MSSEEFLQIKSEDLYDNFVGELGLPMEISLDIVAELEKSLRYTEDFIFRLYVQTAKLRLLYIEGKRDMLVSELVPLIERATALKVWELVSYNLNMLGNVYFSMKLYEKAFEYYYKVILNDKAHGLVRITPNALFNMGAMHFLLSENAIATQYIKDAIAYLKKQGESTPGYQFRLANYVSILVPVLIDDISKVEEYISILDAFQDNPAISGAYNCNIAYLNYYFAVGEIEKALETMEKLRSMSIEPKDVFDTSVSVLFCDQCMKANLDTKYYLEDIKYLEKLHEEDSPYASKQSYEVLTKYYKLIGYEQKYNFLYEKYIHYLEAILKNNDISKVESFKTISKLLAETSEYDTTVSKNQELKMLAEEALKSKERIEEINQRIAMINELGKKLTTSLNVMEIVDTVYQNLKKNVPVTTFVIVVDDPETDMLKTVAYYDAEEFLKPFSIKKTDANSIFAQSFNEKKFILIDDLYNDERYSGKPIVKIGTGHICSAVFMPLSVGDKVIGVCTVQDARAKVYDEKDILFMEELVPYLSIAINNAMKSEALEKEIRMRIQAESELTSANDILQRLSSMDGLTQISNRRVFELKANELLHQAEYENLGVAFYMFDIDFFKKYNDTYGHLEGDEALKAVARAIRKHFGRVGGISARFGGEEFIAATIGLDEQQCYRIATDVLLEIHQLNMRHETSPFGRITVSGGIAISKEHGVINKSMMMRWADTTLYLAKNSGKNRVMLKHITQEDVLPEIWSNSDE